MLVRPHRGAERTGRPAGDQNTSETGGIFYFSTPDAPGTEAVVRRSTGQTERPIRLDQMIPPARVSRDIEVVCRPRTARGGGAARTASGPGRPARLRSLRGRGGNQTILRPLLRPPRLPS